MPFQTLSTEQSKVAEFAINRLGYHILFRLYLLKEIFVQVAFFLHLLEEFLQVDSL